MKIEDIDIVELNEAFAAQVVPCRDELGLDPETLNPFGGAIALGHPFGMTGARIMTTLLNGLRALDGTYGLETMCVAGGMGQAMIVERLDTCSLSGDADPVCVHGQHLPLADRRGRDAAAARGRGPRRSRSTARAPAAGTPASRPTSGPRWRRGGAA